MLAFGYDEFAASAPQWYRDVVAALDKDDIETAKALAKNALDKKREVASLLAMMSVSLEQGDTIAAKSFADGALQMAKGTNAIGEAAAVLGLAKVHLKDRSVAEAMTSADKALEVCRVGGNKSGEAAALCTKARLSQPEEEETLDMANTALSLFRGVQDTKGAAFALNTIISIKLDEGNPAHAENVSRELVRLFQGAGDRLNEAKAKMVYAQVLQVIGNMQDALQQAHEAAELYSTAGESRKKASAANLLATLLQDAGMYEDAIKASEASVALCKAAKDKSGQANALCVLASVLDSQHKYSKAAYKLEKAASIYRQLGSKREEASALDAVARAQLKTFGLLDDPSEPAEAAERAVALYGELGMEFTPECGYGLQTVAFALLAAEKPNEAMAKAKEALMLFQSITNLSGEAASHTVLAQIHWAMKDKDEAVKAANRAHKLASQAGDMAEMKWAQQLLDEYGGKAGKGDSVDMAGFTSVSGQVLRSSWVAIYVMGKPHCDIDGFVMRGTSATQPQKKSSKSSAALFDEEVAGQTQQEVVHSIDFQSLGAL